MPLCAWLPGDHGGYREGDGGRGGGRGGFGGGYGGRGGFGGGGGVVGTLIPLTNKGALAACCDDDPVWNLGPATWDLPEVWRTPFALICSRSTLRTHCEELCLLFMLLLPPEVHRAVVKGNAMIGEDIPFNIPRSSSWLAPSAGSSFSLSHFPHCWSRVNRVKCTVPLWGCRFMGPCPKRIFHSSTGDIGTQDSDYLARSASLARLAAGA